jgi:hypothetical protein
VIRALSVFLPVVVFLGGCDHKVPTLSTEPSAENPAPATTGSVKEDERPRPEDEPEDAPVALLSPAVLTGTWPSLVGHHVQLYSRVLRTVDFTDALVVARGREFLVTASPQCFWSGTKLRTFTVLGTATVDDHGPVALPNLLLDDETCGS